MRFESIGLQRYGHFSDQDLVFPRREHDFHLIIGSNEAGKSTLRQAFHDLLFGIPMNSPMAFLHAGPELALNAVVSGEAGELAMGRRRKRNGGLVDAVGDKLAPETWARWLGGVTPAFHERMFGLDHRRLEQGSHAMLQAGDDVDSVLFQAAAGLAALNDVLAGLRDEAAGLWTPHHSRSRAWYAASDRLKDADKALKAATVRPTAWQETHRESRRLDDAFSQARDDCARLRAELMGLERLRRLAPLLVQIRSCEALLDTQEKASEAVPLLLAMEADVLALEETRLRVAGHRAAIDQGESEIGLLHEEISRLLRQLGRTPPGTDRELDDVVVELPAHPLRQEIGQLLNQGKDLRTRRDASQRALQTRLAEVNDMRARIDALPEGAVGAAVRQALDAATAAGDVMGALDALRRQAQREEDDLGRRLAALRQPGVAFAEDVVAQLADMRPWPAEALVEHVQRRRQLHTDTDMADKRVRDAQLELNDARLRVEQFRRSHEAVSRDEVVAARRERDALWDSLATGRQPLASQAERYASLVLLADVLADRHFAAVDDAARLQGLEHECERLEAGLQGLAELRDAAVGALAAHEAEWKQACAQRQLPGLPPAALQGWLPGRDAALQAHERLQATHDELTLLQQRHDTLARNLQTALESERARAGAAAAGLEDSSDAGQGVLQASCEAARRLLQAADGLQARRDALTEQLQRLEPLLPALEQESRNDAAAYEAWLQRRQAVLQRAGLPGDADDVHVETAIALLADIDGLMGRLRERRAQRDRLHADLRHFDQAAHQVADRLGAADFQPGMAQECVSRWVAQLTPLRQAAHQRDQARQQLADLHGRLLEEAQGRDRQEVEKELAAVDVASLGTQSDALSVRLDEAEHRRDRLAVEREQARAALEAVSGADDAAQAEARRQEALADMGEIAERYVQVYAQYRLLEHITERYRERSQGPLLAHAGRLFSALTLGAHQDLVVDGDAATLWARRADGRLVPLDGLSDGTRDQLYLALRLAALELYLDSAAPMPFIADDLFVNYDDGRALAGLRQLAEVSGRTQVIFLTHHAHMVELARANLAGQVNVIELPGATAGLYTD